MNLKIIVAFALVAVTVRGNVALSQVEPTEILYATPGVERFVVAGLRIGDDFEQVKVFLQYKALNAIPEKAKMSTIRGNKSNYAMPYLGSQKYTNGKSGVNEITATLTFTPPLETSKGMSPLVREICYETFFGEGISAEEVMRDLEKKYGKHDTTYGNDPIGTSKWFLQGKSKYPINVMEVFLVPSFKAGERGRLMIRISDSTFTDNTFARAREYVDKRDADRMKDTTKPTF